MGALINSGIGAYESTSKAVKTSFELNHRGVPIFERYFNGQSETVIDIENSRISIPNHNFVSGEEVEYNYDYDFLHEPIGIKTTTIAGVGLTDILPSRLYIIRDDGLHIRFADSPENATVEFPIPIELRSVGIGTLHKIASKDTDSRVLLAVDNIIQSPLVGTGVTVSLLFDVNTIVDIIGVSTTTNLYNGDLIKVNDEIMEIRTVGFSSANYLLVRRPVVGTNLGIHTVGNIVEKLSGNYTITGNQLNFTGAPFGIRPTAIGITEGASFNDFDYTGINTSSKFSGRVFTRSAIPGSTNKAYHDNYIFDDISEQFTGISSEFYLKTNKTDVSNFNLDSSLLLIRDVFQTPTVTYNNFNSGNYELNVGVSSVQVNFTGLVEFNQDDVNSSGVPIGGVISSVGSSEGFAYQKLKVASASPTLSPSGTIQSIEINDSGSGYRPTIQNPINVYAKTGDFNNELIVKVGEAVVGEDINNKGRIVSINITNPGSDYSVENSPEIIIDQPLNYTNIPLVYSSSSQPGVGTGAKIDVVVGQGSSIISFEIKEYGYGYKPGDILTLPFGYDNGGIEGLVDFDYNVLTVNQSINPGITTTFDSPTVVDDGILVYVDDTGTLIIGDNKYVSILEEFQIYVDSVYKDKFSSWSFGELEIFDSPQNLFNGRRTVFPLTINGIPKSIVGDFRLDLQSALIVFVNGILQVPGEGYVFNGGSTIRFTDPPNGPLEGTQNTGDTCQIAFYRGTKNVDVINVDILESIKKGDTVRLLGTEDIYKQDSRLVHRITSTSRFDTNIYAGVGIVSDTSFQRSLYWSKQREDLFVDGQAVTKDRPLYEPKIYPVTNIIKNVGTAASTSIYVEAAKAFFDNYREDINGDVFEDIEILDQSEKIRASATAYVSSGIVTSIIVTDGGSGYENGTNPLVSISVPVGVGTTGRATAYGNVSSGKITSITITNPGYGYTSTPEVFIEQPAGKREVISGVSYIGDYGVVTGIVTTSIGVGSTGLTFSLYVPEGSSIRDTAITGVAITVSQLQQGDYFTVKNSYVGNGITSLDLDGNIIGIGTTFVDNVYQVYSTSFDSKTFDTTETISGFEIYNSPGVIDEGITITIDDDSILVIDEFSTTNVTVRVAEVYSSLDSLSPTLFYADYSWSKIQTVGRRSPKTFESYNQNGVVGLTTSPIVRRINPLNYVDYIS